MDFQALTTQYVYTLPSFVSSLSTIIEIFSRTRNLGQIKTARHDIQCPRRNPSIPITNIEQVIGFNVIGY
ncbi:hypothetical protein ASPFODRAFT_43829 [Aspergillus luchuensis CBS 106.47]|uniref:Uncharacterized protein n=1 Tax=Aspergillus luchuensis (strain CBS 106.47) TaxID=1137211 RepID=A0A1M3TNC9_ASPLC|nr:hypothetical protein ASPFODRAFT_43829 [Aspergillus luchuensis CBS 106.47]